MPPAINISAITNCPGSAKAKKVDKKLSNILKLELFKKAPKVNILKPRPIAGVPNACLIPCLIELVIINILFNPYYILFLTIFFNKLGFIPILSVLIIYLN